MAKLKPNQFILAGHLITERPILFQTDMVRATLDDRKTDTRRTKGLQSINECPVCWQYKGTPMKPLSDFHVFVRFNKNNERLYIKHIFSPFGKPGDLLWVREKFTPLPFDMVNQRTSLHFSYFADCDADSLELAREYGFKWKPSIHMPKSASRIWVMIEDIRVERLQDISDEDAIVEGIFPHLCPINGKDILGYKNYWHGMMPCPPIKSFQTLWESINGEESWNSNPWVWVIKFRVLSKYGRPSDEEILASHLSILASQRKEVKHV